MREAAALSSLGVVLALVLTRPRVQKFQIGPAHAAAVGVVLMLMAGLVRPFHVLEAGRMLWGPLVTVTAIMVMAAAARRAGVLEQLASALVPLARGSGSRLFALVFGLSAMTSAVLNNDAAVLLLTPLVVLLIQRLYPDRRAPIVPFAFAVFMAAGVAPFMVSNPMNMILASFARIGFNTYAATMVPIAIAGWLVSFVVLRFVFRGPIRITSRVVSDPSAVTMTRHQWKLVAVIVCVFGSYPLVAYFDGPIWVVALVGAVLCLWFCSRNGNGRPQEVMATEVSWETLFFLFGALIVALGLRNSGVVGWLAGVYSGADVVKVGVASAFGSAVINNHPMALTNLFALDHVAVLGRDPYLAAMIGGDLGPRLLPIGSLAGLLWLASLKKVGVEVSIGRFAAVGAAVTVPSLAVSLVLLSIL